MCTCRKPTQIAYGYTGVEEAGTGSSESGTVSKNELSVYQADLSRKASVANAAVLLNCKLHIMIILKRNISLSKYDSTSATCTFTNTQLCQSTVRNLVFKCVCRLNTYDNALIKALLDYIFVVYPSRIRITANSFSLEAVTICTRCILVSD